jgi:hypothetical protein
MPCVAPAFRPAVAAPFANGDFITYGQESWGDEFNVAGQFLSTNFHNVFAPSNLLIVGGPNGTGLHNDILESV